MRTELLSDYARRYNIFISSKDLENIWIAHKGSGTEPAELGDTWSGPIPSCSSPFKKLIGRLTASLRFANIIHYLFTDCFILLRHSNGSVEPLFGQSELNQLLQRRMGTNFLKRKFSEHHSSCKSKKQRLQDNYVSNNIGEKIQNKVPTYSYMHIRPMCSSG